MRWPLRSSHLPFSACLRQALQCLVPQLQPCTPVQFIFSVCLEQAPQCLVQESAKLQPDTLVQCILSASPVTSTAVLSAQSPQLSSPVHFSAPPVTSTTMLSAQECTIIILHSSLVHLQCLYYLYVGLCHEPCGIARGAGPSDMHVVLLCTTLHS